MHFVVVVLFIAAGWVAGTSASTGAEIADDGDPRYLARAGFDPFYLMPLTILIVPLAAISAVALVILVAICYICIYIIWFMSFGFPNIVGSICTIILCFKIYRMTHRPVPKADTHDAGIGADDAPADGGGASKPPLKHMDSRAAHFLNLVHDQRGEVSAGAPIVQAPEVMLQPPEVMLQPPTVPSHDGWSMPVPQYGLPATAALPGANPYYST